MARVIDGEQLDALVAEARAGSGPAFTRRWEMLAPAVAGYVRGRGARDVDDVTSEVFLSAFRSIGRFTGEGEEFRRWLFTIAHHRCVDDLRRRVRQGTELAFDDSHDPRSSDSAEAEVLRRSGGSDVLDLLDRLPDDQQDVLLLRVVAELPVERVATILDRSPEAVRQLQHRALTRLRREFAGSTPRSALAAPRNATET